MPTCMHCSLTVLTLILLYGGNCFSVWLPSKVTLRLPALHNKVHAPTCDDYMMNCLMDLTVL